MLYARDFLFDQNILGSRSDNRSPKVSIILPTYRRLAGGLLERSIKSVLSQTFEDFELLVMDDGSSDGSYDLIEDFRRHDARIVHVRHDQNCGLPALRVNEGIELARGKYLAFQFDDDFWRHNALQDLVAEADKHTEAFVVVGKSHFTMKVGQIDLPNDEVNNLTLHERNRFANNSALFPRQIVHKYGMYDPHIGMRRLCDWDLWLRLVKHLPFIVIDSVISDVFESVPGSIGLTVPYDVSLFRFINSIPRNHLLTLERWRDYPLDTLKMGEVELPDDFRRRMYEEQIVPYYFHFRHLFPRLEGFSATVPDAQPKTLAYTKLSYEIGNDILMTNFDAAMNRRGSYKSFYQYLGEANPGWVQESDILLLMRTVEEQANHLLDLALEVGMPVGYCMDDDLLTFHEFGPKFDYLAPGTPYYQNLTYQLERVDAVIVTSRFIAESTQSYNPRIVPDNGSIPKEYLPNNIKKREPSSPLRIGYVGTGYRIEEFQAIWDAMLRISREFREQINFEFWGMDISSLPSLPSPVIQKPFTFNYYNYLEALGNAGFDILLTPMLDYPRPRLGKARIKYYETAVAGALGIFSDVPQYETLQGGLTCLKAKNTPEEWYRAIRKAIEMPPDHFDQMRWRCLAHVSEEFTVEGQIHHHEAALRAVEFHGKTRDKRYPDGRPRVLYAFHSAFMGGAEIQLWRRLHLARNSGVEPIVLMPLVLKDTDNAAHIRESLTEEGIQLEFAAYTCFTEPRNPAEFSNSEERSQIYEILERCNPALVHTITFIPSIGQVCSEMGIPHVATLYQVDEEFSWLKEQPDFVHCTVVQSDSMHYATRWSQLLGGTTKICSRGMAPDNLFELGQRTYLEKLGEESSEVQNQPLRLVVTGTFQERKRQLETIEAVGRLKQNGILCQLTFYGYTHFFPEYMEKCKKAIKKWRLSEYVKIHDFTEDIEQVLASADVMLSLSEQESFPTSISDAMASGVLVVATPVGGIPELIIDNVSGLMCRDTSVDGMVDGIRRALSLSLPDRQRIVEHARRVARSEFHPFRIANDLFRMYNLALDFHLVGTQEIRAIPMHLSGDRRVDFHGGIKEPPTIPSSVIQVGAGLVYDLQPENENWNGLDIMVGTHSRPASGELVLKVISQTGQVLRLVSADLTRARDNDWLKFRFDPIKNSAGQRFRLEFTLKNPGPQTILSLYQSSPIRGKYRRAFQKAFRSLGFRLRGNQLYYRESWVKQASASSL